MNHTDQARFVTGSNKSRMRIESRFPRDLRWLSARCLAILSPSCGFFAKPAILLAKQEDSLHRRQVFVAKPGIHSEASQSCEIDGQSQPPSAKNLGVLRAVTAIRIRLGKVCECARNAVNTSTPIGCAICPNEGERFLEKVCNHSLPFFPKFQSRSC